MINKDFKPFQGQKVYRVYPSGKKVSGIACNWPQHQSIININEEATHFFSLESYDEDGVVIKDHVYGLGLNKYTYIPYENIKKKLVPFTWEDREQLRGKWIKPNNEDSEYQILSIFEEGIRITRGSGSYEFLLKHFTFLDGSPCGKYVEDNTIEDD